MRNRPLEGVKILEFAGIGPGPFCGMLLSDLGADIVRIDRPGVSQPGVGAVTGRGRRSISLDLKSEQDRETVLELIETADALFEGFRPGVMERNGLGPEQVMERNPALVYGRMTGWGQTGPLSHAAGHDLNYIAISGALGTMGRPNQPPVPPLNLVGDYGGGAMFLAVGLLAGILQAKITGKGQVVDAAMTDGSALLMAMFYDLVDTGIWEEKRGSNFLDGSAPFYDTYECADGAYIAIGAIETQFYSELLEKLGISETVPLSKQMHKKYWANLKSEFADIFKTKTRDEWVELLEGTDACFAPVLTMSEAPKHPHNIARETFVDFNGSVQPAAAPRFKDVPSTPLRPAPKPGEHTKEILRDWLGEDHD